MRTFSYGLMLAGALLTQGSFASEQVSPTSEALTEFFTQAKGAKNGPAAVNLLENMDASLREKLCTEIVEADFFLKASNAGVMGARASMISTFCQEKMREFKKQQAEVGTLEDDRKKIAGKEFTKEQAKVNQLGQKATQFEAPVSSPPTKSSGPVSKLGARASKFEEAALKQAAEEQAAAEREIARLKAQEEARLRAAEAEAAKQKTLEEEAAAKQKALEEEAAAQIKAAEAEAEKQKAAEEEAAAKIKAAEEEAHLRVEADARSKATEAAEEEARLRAEADARSKATEAARLRAEEEERAAKHVADAMEQAAQLEKQYQELQRKAKLEGERAESEGRKAAYEKKKANIDDRLELARKQLQEAEGYISHLNMLISFIRDDLKHEQGFEGFSQTHQHDNSEQYLDALNIILGERDVPAHFKQQAVGASEALKQAYANYAKARLLLQQIQAELSTL